MDPVTEFFQQGIADFFKERSSESDVYLANFDKLNKLQAITGYDYWVDTIRKATSTAPSRSSTLSTRKGHAKRFRSRARPHLCLLAGGTSEFRADAEDWPGTTSTSISTSTPASRPPSQPAPAPTTRCTTLIETVKEAWAKGKQALEYLVNVLQGTPTSTNGATSRPHTRYIPLIVHVARNGGTFTNEHEKRDFLHWMYAALMWGRYSGSSETKLNVDLAALSEADPSAQLRENLCP